MATSEVDIINSALMRLGEDPISARTENNKRARIMNSQYDTTREALLRSYVWNFAKERIELSALVEEPEFGYLYQALLPARTLRVLGRYDEAEAGYQHNYSGAREPFKVEGRNVLTDDNPIRLFIIQDVTDVAQFDALFSVTLSWALAMDTAVAITNDKGKYGIAEAGFKTAVRAARSANAMEGTPEAFESSTWLESRRYYGNRGPYRMGPVYY